MNKILQRGSALAVVVPIVAIIAGSTIYMMQKGKEAPVLTQTATSKIEWNTYRQKIEDSINSGMGCENTLVANNIKLADSFINVYDKVNTLLVTSDTTNKANQYPSSNNPIFEIVSMKVIDKGVSLGTTRNAEIQMTIRHLKKKYGATEFVDKFPIKVTAAGANAPITSCHGATSSFTPTDFCIDLLGGTLVDVGNEDYRCLNIDAFQGPFLNSVANSNIAFGMNALAQETQDARITAFGFESMAQSSGNADVVAFGVLSNNLSNNGIANTGFGGMALFNGKNGDYNTAVGAIALFSLEQGNSNTAIGLQAQGSNIDKSLNTCVGASCMLNNNANENMAVGYRSLLSNANGLRNLAVGESSLKSLDGGNDNTFIGHQSGVNINTASSSNVGVGYASSTNLNGNYNVAVGAGSLGLVSTSIEQTMAIGTRALLSNKNGKNIAIGAEAADNAVNLEDSVSVGYQAAKNITGTSADNNIAIGIYSLSNGTNSTKTVAIGSESMMNASANNGTVAIGSYALRNNPNASYNTVVGFRAGFESDGAYHTLIGSDAGYFAGNGTNTEGLTAAGYQALSNSSAASNTAAGYRALSDITTGSGNTAIGFQAGAGALTIDESTFVGAHTGEMSKGDNNIGIGDEVLKKAESGAEFNIGIGGSNLQEVKGSYNIALGYYAGDGISNGNANMAIGPYALRTSGLDGEQNIAVGYGALYDLSGTSAENTAVGTFSGYNVKNGSGNTFIGHRAGSNKTLGYATYNNNILIGANAGATTGPGAGEPAYCNFVSMSNRFIVATGDSCKNANENRLLDGFLTALTPGGNPGIGIGGAPVDDGTNYFALTVKGVAAKTDGTADWTYPSDRRLKKNIVDYPYGLKEILSLTPIYYRYKNNSGIDPTPLHVGVSAQEVQEVIPEAIETSTSEILHLNPSYIWWSSIKATQEIHALSKSLEQSNREFHTQDMQDLEGLKKKIVTLEENNLQIEKDIKTLREILAKHKR